LQENQNNKAASDAAVYQYKALKGSVKKNIRIFNELYAQYCALFTEWRGISKDKTHPPANILSKDKFDSVFNLENEIRLLENNIRTEVKRAYIREQIDEVMKRFGYNVSESIVLRGTTKGQSYLFESDSKAVHLFMSDTNRIMFEPVGLENLEENGHAGYDGMAVENISESDRAAIYEDQKDFCELHPKMIKELEKRGVLMGSTKIKEADIKTAKLLKIKGKQTKKKQEEAPVYRHNDEQNERDFSSAYYGLAIMKRLKPKILQYGNAYGIIVNALRDKNTLISVMKNFGLPEKSSYIKNFTYQVTDDVSGLKRTESLSDF